MWVSLCLKLLDFSHSAAVSILGKFDINVNYAVCMKTKEFLAIKSPTLEIEFLEMHIVIVSKEYLDCMYIRQEIS